MAQEKDDRYIPVVSGSGNVPNLQALNEIIKQTWQAIHALEGRVGDVAILSGMDVAGEVAADSFSTIGNVIAAPVVGKWAQVTSEAGTGNFVWSTALIENSDYFEQATSNEGIVFLQDGTYLIMASLVAEDDTNAIEVDMLLNIDAVAHYATTIAAAGNTSFFLASAVEASANDVVYLELVVGTTRVGDASYSTQLIIYKLN